MSVITVYSGTYCREEAVIRGLASRMRFDLVSDTEIVQQASALSDLGESKIMRAFSAKSSVFQKFTHEKERSVAFLKLALAQRLPEDRTVIHGFVSHLIPKTVTHVLRVCLIADVRNRVALAKDAEPAADEGGVGARVGRADRTEIGRSEESGHADLQGREV